MRDNVDMSGKVVYGANAVREALRSKHQVNRLYLARDGRVRDAEGLIALAREKGVPFDFVPLAKVNAMAESDEHQGVAATVSPVGYAEFGEWLATCPATALVLALDQIQHPKNLGMLLRTALGAGASGVLLTARGGALIDESVVRASAGAVYHVPVVNCKNLGQALRKLRDGSFWSYGLDATGETSVFEAQWGARTVLVLGNETSGIRPGVRKHCDALVRIPLAAGLDSLNAATAAGVALFQAATALGTVG